MEKKSWQKNIMTEKMNQNEDKQAIDEEKKSSKIRLVDW